MRMPSRRSAMSPADLRSARCLETLGWGCPKMRWMSQTQRERRASRLMIRKRVRSPSARKKRSGCLICLCGYSNIRIESILVASRASIPSGTPARRPGAAVLSLRQTLATSLLAAFRFGRPSAFARTGARSFLPDLPQALPGTAKADRRGKAGGIGEMFWRRARSHAMKVACTIRPVAASGHDSRP
jgi:hypothetical protein